jgi:hypothetical protein
MEPARPPNYRFRGIVSVPAFREQILKFGLDGIDATTMGHRLTGQEGADDVGRLLEPGIAFGLVGPGLAGNVLVDRLAAAQSAGIHLAQCCSDLGEHRRIVAPTWCGDHAEGQPRAFQRGTQPS